MSWASLLHFPPVPDVPAFARGRSFAVVMAAFLGSAAEGRVLLAPLRRLGPARDTFATVPPVVLGDLAMDPLDPVPVPQRPPLLDGLPPEAIDALIARSAPARARPDRDDAAVPPHGRRAGARGAGRRRPRDAARRDQHVRARRRLRRAVGRRGARRPRRRGGRRCCRTAPATTRTSSRCRPTPAPSSTRRLGAPARGQGRLRPRRPVRGQPPHPAAVRRGLRRRAGGPGRRRRRRPRRAARSPRAAARAPASPARAPARSASSAASSPRPSATASSTARRARSSSTRSAAIRASIRRAVVA